MGQGAALAFLAIGAGALLMLGGGTASASTQPGNANGQFPGLAGCTVESNIPDSLKATVSAFLQKSGLGPADYTQIANAAQAAGFPLLAGCLRQKGAQLNSQLGVEVAAKGGMPFVIRYGDIPYNLAQYYTGAGSRFHELEPLNPQIGSLVTVNGVSNYSHWAPGVQILIPVAWNPLSKPLPAPLTGGGGAAPVANTGGLDLGGVLNTIGDIINGGGTTDSPPAGDGTNGDTSGTYQDLPNNDNPGSTNTTGLLDDITGLFT